MQDKINVKDQINLVLNGHPNVNKDQKPQIKLSELPPLKPRTL
jgi:hypothetical protein